jgi:Streptomyces sporulation and cell division protein, SsgA
MGKPTTISSQVSANILDSEGGRHRLNCRLAYDSHDPFAVQVTFAEAHAPAELAVTWVMARDLLFEATFRPTGEGDVHAWPAVDDDGAHVVGLLLCSPDGEALVEVNLPGLMSFLDHAMALVPQGSESELLDVDAAIAAILAAAEVRHFDEN